jgi:outer membrane protein OmpA-like peptidoglycan-associated protein
MSARAGTCAALAVTLTLAAARDLSAQAPARRDPAPRIPLAAGVILGQTLQYPDGDRESLVTILDVSASGARYRWQYTEARTAGDTTRRVRDLVVSRADLASAERWRDAIEGEEKTGYTVFSLSSAVYEQLEKSGTAGFAIVAIDDRDNPLALLGLGTRTRTVLWRGTLSRAAGGATSFPIIVNGRRTSVPALQLRGRFTASRQRRWEPDIWVLADREHPVLLKVASPDGVWQTVRIDSGSDRGRGSPAELERELGSACRLELGGIYFGFNSAELYEASDEALASLADVLRRHPDWAVTIEGHTDSIGSTRTNQVLSQQRADAVRMRLAGKHGLNAARLHAAGKGAGMPRESNATVEGRARNRRVEVVRDCASGNAKGDAR